MRVSFRADASQATGGGHVMRCLALAEALAGRGADCTFVSAWSLPALEAMVGARGHRFVRIEEPATPASGGGWESVKLDGEAQRRDAERTIAAAGQADWVVVDHYWLGAPWEAAASGQVLAIDDLVREHDCDLLLDQTVGRARNAYRGLVPDRTTVLAGSPFALLRPEFASLRPQALKRKRSVGPVRRILVSLGLSDMHGITGEALRSLLESGTDCAIDVVIGSEAASRGFVEAAAETQPELTVHVDSTDLAQLMLEADLAIGAPGTSSLERCCLALPTINLVLADNQRETGERLAEIGAAMCVGKAGLTDAIRQIIGDEALRTNMAAAAAGVTDGTGADSVASKMFGDAGSAEFRMRRATAADSERIWLWRNNPDTRQGSQTRHAVTWAEHEDWFRRTMASPDNHLFIVERSAEPVAVLRFDRIAGTDAAFVVSINVKPTARGGGTGRAALAEACSAFLAANGAARLEAKIHPDNAASRNIFESLAFGYSGKDGDSGFDRFVRNA